ARRRVLLGAFGIERRSLGIGRCTRGIRVRKRSVSLLHFGRGIACWFLRLGARRGDARTRFGWLNSRSRRRRRGRRVDDRRRNVGSRDHNDGEPGNHQPPNKKGRAEKRPPFVALLGGALACEPRAVYIAEI